MWPTLLSNYIIWYTVGCCSSVACNSRRLVKSAVQAITMTQAQTHKSVSAYCGTKKRNAVMSTKGRSKLSVKRRPSSSFPFYIFLIIKKQGQQCLACNIMIYTKHDRARGTTNYCLYIIFPAFSEGEGVCLFVCLFGAIGNGID